MIKKMYDLFEPFRIKQLIVENNIPKWQDDDSVRYIKDTNDSEGIKIPESMINKEPLKSKIVKKTPLVKQFPAKFIMDNMNRKDILLVVDNKLNTIISATPLIKRLFSFFGKIDILTDNLVFP